jgi:hypothetical protein
MIMITEAQAQALWRVVHNVAPARLVREGELTPDDARAMIAFYSEHEHQFKPNREGLTRE